MKTPLTVLEKGDIYFFYRPRVNSEEAKNKKEVSRFFFILRNNTTGLYRVVIVEKKQLPRAAGHQVEFAFVAKVGTTLEEIHEYLDEQHYSTKTKGERTLSAALSGGEGKYLFLKWGKATHLLYSLEKSEKRQERLHGVWVEGEAIFIIQVKNPENPSPKGLSTKQRADYPPELANLFKNRRFMTLDPVDFLNYEGAEILIIGEKSKPTAQWRINLKSLLNSFSHARIDTPLDLGKKQQELEFLLAGDWS